MDALAIFQAPVSFILALAFLALVGFSYNSWSENVVFRFLRSRRWSFILCGVLALMLAVEGTWGVRLHDGPLFLFLEFLLIFSLGQTIINRVLNGFSWSFFLNHFGIFLILWGSFFGAADVERGRVVLRENSQEHVAYSLNGQLISLPFSLKLKSFTIDTYADGVSPKQYTSHLEISSLDKEVEVSVNHPFRHRGLTLYQEGFNLDEGECSILGVVRDPWWPMVLIGMCVLSLGALLLIRGRIRLRIIIPLAFLVTAVFSLVTLARISLDTLMPALRSVWFVPHILVYMLAYSVLAIALCGALLGFWKKSGLWEKVDVLLRCSSALLIIGMLLGAVWANEAWGDYWAWDAKENWAAVTWLLTLLYLHHPPEWASRKKWKLSLILLAFLAIQVTWYGVNYLPSASQSLHTYTR